MTSGNHLLRPIALAVLAASAWAQGGNLVPVVSRPASRTIDLPGEIAPYLSVALHARVAGYVERVLVDRGSVVKRGELLAELTAPEMQAQIAEAESKVQAAESDRLQAEAQLAAANATYERLRKASETPGAVAGNELIQAQKQAEAAEAAVKSRQQASHAAAQFLRARKDLEAYLKITAPFDGVVTTRLVHPGALVGPGTDSVLLTIDQVSHLRLIVPVPEEDVGAMARGASVAFRVPAFPERTYTGAIARVSHALDTKTRTMPVELDVFNRDGSLAPGMYPNVKWPVHGGQPVLFVPKTAVVTTTERTFVIRDRDGHAEWVDVKKGPAESDLVSVSGDLKAGDKVVRRATDELREGAPVPTGR
ncbi:MAG: efflux RND transporter periplasmic adaptor subunit [Bryobacteraceae bacterium]